MRLKGKNVILCGEFEVAVAVKAGEAVIDGKIQCASKSGAKALKGVLEPKVRRARELAGQYKKAKAAKASQKRGFRCQAVKTRKGRARARQIFHTQGS